MSAPKKPALVVVHKILIASAAVLAGLMAIWSFFRGSVWIGAVSVFVGITLWLYFRTIDRRYGGGDPPPS